MKFLRGRLKPAWTFTTKQKVWRLLTGNGVVAVELRDTEARTAEYAALDLASGSPLWEHLSLPDSWWVIMNRIHRDVLLLQQFVKPDMPNPGKVFALDLFTGKVIWENHDVSFINVTGDTIYAVRSTIQSEEIVGIDYRSGRELISFSVDDPRADQISVVTQDDNLLLPRFAEELEGILNAARIARLKSCTPADAINPTFIPSSSGRDVLGFHSGAGKDEKGVPVFDSKIKVLDPDGKTIYEDIADRNVYTAMSDFYFVAEGNLIYVRNSNEIVAVRLEQ